MRYIALVDAAGEQDTGQRSDGEHWHVLAAVCRPGTRHPRRLQFEINVSTLSRIDQRPHSRGNYHALTIHSDILKYIHVNVDTSIKNVYIKYLN